MHPVNGTEVHTNEILNLAPTEGQAPLSVSKEPYFEAMSFPILFPTAENTYHVDECRPVILCYAKTTVSLKVQNMHLLPYIF